MDSTLSDSSAESAALCLPAARTALRTRAHVARSAARRGDVTLQGIVHNHAVGVEPPAESANGALHALNPAARQTIHIALVVEGNHFLSQDPVEILAVPCVVNVHVGVGTTHPDGKSVQAVISFRPPAIQHGEIEPAVQNHFLSAGARSFERTTRIVQPYVNALDEMAADVDVVVFYENKLIGEFRVAHQICHTLQDALAGVVERMRLTGKNKLHGALRVVNHGGEQLDIAEN